VVAKIFLYLRKFLHGTGVLGANCHAAAAAGAFPLIQGQLQTHMLGLRIGAPLTAQIASLKEHRGANARSIVEAEFLYIKDHTYQPSPPPHFLDFIV
jgi:hypothetical protein